MKNVFSMNVVRLALAATPAMLCGAMLNGCATAPTTPEGKEKLSDSSTDAMTELKNSDPSLEGFLNNAYGYVLFPAVGKGAAGVGGAYGRGEVFEHGKKIGYADVSLGSVGLQAGGQTYVELIAFENEDALNKFKGNRMELAATASAVAIRTGAATSAKYDNGVAIFVKPTSGFMAEASIGGQQFTYQAVQNADNK